MTETASLGGLFLAAFLAATLLPAQSELLLAGLYAAGGHSPWALLAAASAGNVLGSAVNWGLGRYLVHFQHRRWFPLKPESLDKATRWYRRWGAWSLLLAWVPVIGDPLTFAAGVLRVNFWLFFVLVTIGKVGRYVAVMTAAASVQ